MSTLAIAEVFAGIGGVVGGFLDAGGFEPVFLNDKDPVARQAFVRNFPRLADRYHVRSVRGLTGPDIVKLAGGAVDGLLGCPPCQGLSSAGPRSEDDERNELLHEMHRLIWSIEPKFFVIENVPSLLQTRLYRVFNDSLARRYALKGEVLNAAEYGIPQLRRRAVIIGFRRDLDLSPSMPRPTHGGRGRVFDYNSCGYVYPRTQEGRTLLQLRLRVRLPRGRALVTLRRALGDLPASLEPGEEATMYERPAETSYQRTMRRHVETLTHHKAWNHDDETVEFLARVSPGECPRALGQRSRNTTYFSQAYARLHWNGLARTITTNFHNPGSGRFTHYAAPRAITVREALRLQGFPDTFQFDDDTTKSDAERLVGNAFPRPLARALARHIRHLVAD
jgi:DNA (cytosine-5)-methyltransferase 1